LDLVTVMDLVMAMDSVTVMELELVLVRHKLPAEAKSATPTQSK
jgi:hypothetical protein